MGRRLLLIFLGSSAALAAALGSALVSAALADAKTLEPKVSAETALMDPAGSNPAAPGPASSLLNLENPAQETSSQQAASSGVRAASEPANPAEDSQSLVRTESISGPESDFIAHDQESHPAQEGSQSLSAERERQMAYERSLRALLPSSPQEIRTYRQNLDQREQALSDEPPDTMRTRTQRVRLEPGFKPPLVELTPNLVTALVFTDSTGQPWPIVNSVLGSGALFRTEVLEVEKGNQIIISPLSNHGHSNLVVTLKDNDIPMVIRLATASALKSGREVDTLIIFQVAGNGPSALTTGELPRLPIPVNDSIYAVLDGLVPPGGRLLETSPAPEGERAIESGGSIYLRTGRSLLWPAPRARVAGPGRVWVYELPMVSVVLLSSGGEVGELTIEGIDAPRTAQLGGRAGE